MSDHWEFYPCQIADKTAFISYDHGVSEEIDTWDINQFLWLKMALKSDKGNGLPDEKEYDKLCEIDDQIEIFMKQHSGAYVGRVTADGYRYFHCYVNCSTQDIETFIVNFSQENDYVVEYELENDVEKLRYWEDLFPSEEELGLINDLKVMEQIEKHGHDTDAPMRIDHWIYLKSQESLLKYQEWAVAQGFEIEKAGKAEEPYQNQYEFSLQIYKIDKVLIENISETTTGLVSKAKELDGVYDGWETGSA